MYRVYTSKSACFFIRVDVWAPEWMLHPCVRVFPLLFDPPPPRVLVLHTGVLGGPCGFVRGSRRACSEGLKDVWGKGSGFSMSLPSLVSALALPKIC